MPSEDLPWVYSMSFSPNGQSLLTSNEFGKTNLWTLQGEVLASFAGKKAIFSPDGQKIATKDGENGATLEFARYRTCQLHA